MRYRTSGGDTPLALIIDDDESIRLSMKAALRKVDFDVMEAEDGFEGIAAFRAHNPDLILLDVIMPKMDGYETCHEIRSLPGGEYVQILMVTGLDDIESTERAFEAGANGFVTKPINWAMLGHRGKYMLRAGRAFKELDKSKSRLAKTQKLAKLGNWEIDLVTNEFHCSKEAAMLLGLDVDVAAATFDDFLEPIMEEERGEVQEKIEGAIEARKSFSINYRIVHPNGSEYYILNQGDVLFNDLKFPEIMLGAVQDVTQLKLAEEEVRLLAFYDGLTGLANRMLFLNRLDREIVTAKRHQQSFALLYLDLDQFKLINDTFGHDIGDMLLKQVSEVLQKCIRRSDIASRVNKGNLDTMIARLGGDEFTIVLADLKEPEHAAVVVKRILKEIPKPYILDGNEVSVTTSVGISLYPADGLKGSLLLKNADIAMYQAKKNGRNTYQFYKNSLNSAVVERFSIERDIGKAIERGEFELYYQPKIAVINRGIVGAEALIRWNHPDRGMVPPDKFISIAEESGQIIKINRWVIDTACKQWRQWQLMGFLPGIIAVNLSGYQFGQQNVYRMMRKALDLSGLDSKDIEIEITENILMQDTAETSLVFKQLKEMNIRIALDDFGTGYSSLSYLTSFNVDTLKIDRSFVMHCTDNPQNLIVIKAIIAMGHSLGMKVVAEGVETEEQFMFMREFEVDEAQGYHFSPPVPSKEFEALLKKWEL